MEIKPPPPEPTYKKFTDMFELMKHVYTEVAVDQYVKKYPMTIQFLRRKLKPN